MVVKPETVIRWHRAGFKLYWRWKSRDQVGCPRIIAEIRTLVRRMAQENPTWGAPRIQSELALLGYTVAESTVAKYMSRAHKLPSQTWRTFIENHVGDIVAIDFFVVATVRYRLLYGFIVLCPPPLACGALQRNAVPDSSLDGPADRRSVSLR